jgi:hypothetical protein
MSDPSVFDLSDPESNELAMLDALAASGTDMSKVRRSMHASISIRCAPPSTAPQPVGFQNLRSACKS